MLASQHIAKECVGVFEPAGVVWGVGMQQSEAVFGEG